MKTNEKLVLSRPLAYWMAVLDKIKEGDIIPSGEMKKSMAALSLDMGYSDTYSKANKAKLVEELLKIIPASSYEKVVDVPKGKEKVAYLVTFNDIKAAKEELKKYFSTEKPAKEEIIKKEEIVEKREETKKPEIKAETPKVNKPEKSHRPKFQQPESTKPRVGLDRLAVNQINTVWRILEYLYVEQKTAIRLADLVPFYQQPSIRWVESRLIEDTINKVKQLLNVNIQYKVQTGQGSTELLITNVKESLINVGTKAQEVGIRLPLEKYIGVVNKTNIWPQKAPELTPLEKKAAWLMAGILKENNGYYGRTKLLEVLSKEFHVDLTEASLRNIIHQPEFHYNSGSSRVELMSWDLAKDKYSPENQTHVVHARIGMTLEELQTYFPDSKVISEITPMDNIFEIVYNESRIDLYNMMLLVKSFRGTDCLISNRTIVNKKVDELVKETIKGIKSVDRLYRFETL